MARRAVNRKPLLPAFEQFGRDRQRIVLHEIGRARDAASVHRLVLIRIYRASRSLNRNTAGNRARHRQLRTQAIGEKGVLLLRAQLELPLHVREDIKRRLAEMVAALAEDAHNHHHAQAENDQEIAHYSSTISMCVLPASSSNLRLSLSE